MAINLGTTGSSVTDIKLITSKKIQQDLYAARESARPPMPEYVQRSPLHLMTGGGGRGASVQQEAPRVIETPELTNPPNVVEQTSQQQTKTSQPPTTPNAVVLGFPQLSNQQAQEIVSYAKSTGTRPVFTETTTKSTKWFESGTYGGTKRSISVSSGKREGTTIFLGESSIPALKERQALAEKYSGWTAEELLTGKYVAPPKILSFDTGEFYPAEAVFKSEKATRLREENFFNQNILGESLREGIGGRKPVITQAKFDFFKDTKIGEGLSFGYSELTKQRTIVTPFDKKSKEPVPFFTMTPTMTTRTDIKADTSLPFFYRTGALNQRITEPQLFSLKTEKEPNIFKKFTRYTEKLNVQDTETRTLERIGVNFARIPLGVASVVFVAPAKFVGSVWTDIFRKENKTITGVAQFGKDVVSGKAGYSFGEKLRTDSGFAGGQVAGLILAPKILGSTIVSGKNIVSSSWITRGGSVYVGRYKTLGSYFRTTKATYNNIWLKQGKVGTDVLSEGAFIPARYVFRYGESGRLSTAKTLSESISAFGQGKMIFVRPFEKVKTIGRAMSDSPASTPALWMKISKASTGKGAYAWTDLYEAYVSRVKGYSYESGLRVQTSSPARITSSKVTLEGKALAGLEDAGIYVSPSGKGMAYFLRISTEKTSYGLNPVGFFKGLFTNPRVSIFKVRGVAQYPRSVVSPAGFDVINAFQRSVAESGVAFITKRSELGQGIIPRQMYFNTASKKWMMEKGTPEIEATIPLDSSFALERAKSFTIVKGRVVGIQKGRVLYDTSMSAAEAGVTIKNPLEDIYKRDIFISTEGRGISPQFTGKNLVAGEKYTTGLEIAKEQYRGTSSLATPRPIYEYTGSFRRDAYGVPYSETSSRIEAPSNLLTYSSAYPVRKEPTGYFIYADLSLSRTPSKIDESGIRNIPDIRGGGRGGVSDFGIPVIPEYTPSGTPSGSSYYPPIIPSLNYLSPTPKTPTGIPYSLRFPFYASSEKISEKKKIKGKKVRKIKIKDTGVYVLPDLRSVSMTEAETYRKFGRGEAIAPRLTKDIYRSALISFKGYGTGYIPTEQMRTRKIRI